jgi:hypothetical protein
MAAPAPTREPFLIRNPMDKPVLSAICIAAVWVYVALVAVASMAAPMEEFDDAIPLLHAELVQQHAVPAIDFRSFYPPLGPYFTAAAFRLFGRTIIAIRIFGAFLYVLVLLLLDRLLTRYVARSNPLFLINFVVIAAALGFTLALPAWPGFALALIALLTYSWAQQSRAYRTPILMFAGLLTALAILYRVNFGAYVTVIILTDLAIEHSSLTLNFWRGGRWRRMLADSLAYGIPLFACVAVLCLSIFGDRLAAGVGEFTVTSQKIMAQRGFLELEPTRLTAVALLFLPGWLTFRVFGVSGRLSRKMLPPILCGLAIAALAIRMGSSTSVVGLITLVAFAGVLAVQKMVSLPRLERVFLLFYALQLHYFLSRADHMHFKFLPFAGALLLPFACMESIRAPRWSNFLLPRVVASGAIFAFLVILFRPEARVALSNLSRGMDLITESLERPLPDSERLLGSVRPKAAWLFLYSSRDELQALRYLRQVTKKSDPIFVGVRNHARVFVSNLRMYWLSGRPIGVRQFQLEDRIATEPQVQREIIHDLEQNHVNWIVIDREPNPGDKGFVRRAYSGSTLLDQFVAEHFQEDTNFGQYSILRRSGVPLSQTRF